MKEEEQRKKEREALKEQIEHKEMTNQKPIFRDKRLTSFEEIYGTKTPIDVNKIFEKDKEEKDPHPIQRVLILGRAGIGKSTLCQYIAYEWGKPKAQDRLWQDKFELLLYIPLRKILNYKDKDCHPAKAILKECLPFGSSLPWETIDQVLTMLNSKILYILDGYDEVSDKAIEDANETPQGKLIRHFLSQDNVIMTSRPYRIEAYLRSVHCKKPIQRKLENIGFLDKDIDHYIEHFFEKSPEIPGNKLKQFLKTNTNIRGIAHIPINLILICLGWKEHHDRFIEMPQNITVTTLYMGLVIELCRKYLKNKGKIKGNSFMVTNILRHENCQPIIEFLSELAFHQTEQQGLIIEQKEFQRFLKKYQPLEIEEILELGLLKSTDNGTNEANKSYYFIHLTFQEFFAAYYMSEKLKQTDTKTMYKIKQIKYWPEYEIVWWFVAGLLKENTKALEKFFDILEDKNSIDLIGLANQCLLIHCMNESCLNIKEERKIVFLKNLNIWIQGLAKNEYLEQAFEILVNCLSLNQYVFNNPSIVKNFVFLLRDDDNKFRIACRLTHIYNLQEKILEQIVELIKILKEKSHENIYLGTPIFSNLGINNDMLIDVLFTILEQQNNLPAKILESLLEFLYDNRIEVRYRIITILGKPVKLLSKIIDYFVDLIKNEHEDIKIKSIVAEYLHRHYRLYKEMPATTKNLLKNYCYNGRVTKIKHRTFCKFIEIVITDLCLDDIDEIALIFKSLIEKIPIYSTEKENFIYIGKNYKKIFFTVEDKLRFIKELQARFVQLTHIEVVNSDFCHADKVMKNNYDFSVESMGQFYKNSQEDASAYGLFLSKKQPGKQKEKDRLASILTAKFSKYCDLNLTSDGLLIIFKKCDFDKDNTNNLISFFSKLGYESCTHKGNIENQVFVVEIRNHTEIEKLICDLGGNAELLYEEAGLNLREWSKKQDCCLM